MSQPKSSKLPSEYTLEELIDAANREGANEELVPSNDITDHDVFTFIHALKILPGDKKIHKRLLYKLYRNWSPEPVTNNRFQLFMGLFFQTYIQDYYLISKDVMEILRMPFKAIRKIKQDPRKIRNKKHHFDAFLDAYKLHPGSFYVETGVLYYFYDKWAYNNNSKRPLTIKAFFKFLEIYFERKRLLTSKVAFFGIKDDFKQVVTQEEFLKAQEWARKHNERKTKEYKKKIKKKDKRWDKEKEENHASESQISSSKPTGESKE